MSIAVALEDLAEAVAARPFGYLLTVGDDGRPRVLALAPRLVDGDLVFDVGGGRTASNARARPDVSVVFPPTAADDFSLLVDGSATVEGTMVTVEPTWAVRHRPAPLATT